MNAPPPSDDSDEEPILPGADSGLVRVATKVDGSTAWEEGWRPLESLVEHLQFLEGNPSHKPDWDHLLSGLSLLQPLRVLESPLSNFSDFLELEGFLNIHHANMWGVTDHLFFDESVSVDHRESLFRECEELCRRLQRWQSYDTENQ